MIHGKGFERLVETIVKDFALHAEMKSLLRLLAFPLGGQRVDNSIRHLPIK